MSTSKKRINEVPPVAPSNHGRTVSAWVTNGGLMLAATVAAVGVAIPDWTITWIGAGLAAASLIAGGALKAAGHGQRH